MARRISSLFENPTVRYVLDPREALRGRRPRVRVGSHSYFNGGVRVHRYHETIDGHVTVGRYCSIADDVEFFLGGNHHPEWVSTYPHHAHPDEISSRGDIIIGNNVWIGRNAAVLSGVRVGDGAVIGAHALVTADVRPYAIVGGVPATEIRRRFDDDTIDALLDLRWWDWSDEKVREFASLLQSTDVQRFLDIAASGSAP